MVTDANIPFNDFENINNVDECFEDKLHNETLIKCVY